MAARGELPFCHLRPHFMDRREDFQHSMSLIDEELTLLHFIQHELHAGLGEDELHQRERFVRHIEVAGRMQFAFVIVHDDFFGHLSPSKIVCSVAIITAQSLPKFRICTLGLSSTIRTWVDQDRAGVVDRKALGTVRPLDIADRTPHFPLSICRRSCALSLLAGRRGRCWPLWRGLRETRGSTRRRRTWGPSLH
jgi:hypothetical protein